MNKKFTLYLLLSLVFSKCVVSGDSILAALDKTPTEEQDDKWRDERFYYWMIGYDLGNCLKNLYFGDKREAIKSYKEAQQRIKDRIYKDIPYLIEHELSHFSIVKKDEYYFIEEDEEPEGFIRVLVQKEKERLKSVLIPIKAYDNFVKENKKTGIEVTKLYAIKPEKSSHDPITELLENDDRYFRRELVDRIHKTVEYRRNQWKWFKGRGE